MRASQQKMTPDVALFEKYLKPLQNKFENANPTILKKMRLTTASEGGKLDLLNELILEIRSVTDDNSFGGEIKSSQIEKDFRELEGKLKKIIYNKFYNSENKNWFKDITDPYTYDICIKRAQKQNKIITDKLYLEIGLGECFGIIRKNKSILYPIFIDEEKEMAFSNEKMLEAAITTVTEIRNRLIAHNTGTKKKQGDQIITKMYLDKLLYCINDELDI